MVVWSPFAELTKASSPWVLAAPAVCSTAVASASTWSSWCRPAPLPPYGSVPLATLTWDALCPLLTHSCHTHDSRKALCQHR